MSAMNTNPPTSARVTPATEASSGKIVHFIHLDGDGGGPFTVCKHITFYSHFHQIHIIHGGSGRIARLCDELGIAHSRLETATLLDTLLSFPTLVGLFWMLKPDLAILHGQWAGVVGVLAARLAGVSKVLYIAQWPAFYTDWDLLRVARNWITEWISCRFSDEVIAISPSNRTAFLQLYPWLKGKIHALSNSIDEGEMPSEQEIARVRAQFGWQPDRVHVVSVGRLVDQKRVDWLLQAWALNRDLWERARLWIVGDGAERKALERMARELGLGDSCVFLGSQPQGLAFIGAGDITVFTSMYESFGNVSLESMLCGKPVLATHVAGIDSTLRDGVEGFLVPPEDPRALADRLRQLIDDAPLRTRMGQAGRLRVMDFLTPRVLPRFHQRIQALMAVEPT
jgi:glycosyltransferase involved in cell wall biosynthesis